LQCHDALPAAIKAAKQAGGPVIVSQLDRLSRDVHLISGLMMHKMPFIVAELISAETGTYQGPSIRGRQ